MVVVSGRVARRRRLESFSFVVVIREEECEGAGSFDVVSEPGSFVVVVRVLASELALSAAGPCVPRRHVPPGHEAAHEAEYKLVMS